MKTETMIINHKYLLNDEYPTSIVTLRGIPLNNVKEFKYLGSNLHHDQPNTGDIEINHRIQMANAKFAELSNLLQNAKIKIRTRIFFLNSYVRSRLTFSCQNWNLNNTQYEKLDVTYRTLLRRMVRGGFKRIDESENEFRFKYTNAKIHQICGTKDVSIFIKGQQCNYAGHLVRMNVDRAVKQLMFNDDKCSKAGRSVPTLLDQVVSNNNILWIHSVTLL